MILRLQHGFFDKFRVRLKIKNLADDLIVNLLKNSISFKINKGGLGRGTLPTREGQGGNGPAT